MDVSEIWSELDTNGSGQGSMENSCQYGNDVFVLYKRWNISLSEVQLPTPQERPCTMELLTHLTN
jgi:hypothetical protein